MFKNIAYFPSQCARNAPPVMSAVLSALRRAGVQTIEGDRDCDAALIWSVLWSGRMAANQTVYKHYRSQNKPVVIIDIGALHRGHTWKVAINHVNALGYYGHQQDLDPDRPRHLNVSLRSPVRRSDHVLIAAQHQQSLQWQGQPTMEAWVEQQIANLKQHTDRPIKVRPHPRCPLKNIVNIPGVEIQQPRHRPETYDDFDMDLDCYAVINYNSGPGIQAAMSQTPVIVDQSSLAWPVSISMDELENPPGRDHDRWLLEISHTEYTVQELEQGLWLQRLGTKL
jgi:hypothetical protein